MCVYTTSLVCAALVSSEQGVGAMTVLVLHQVFVRCSSVAWVAGAELLVYEHTLLWMFKELCSLPGGWWLHMGCGGYT